MNFGIYVYIFHIIYAVYYMGYIFILYVIIIYTFIYNIGIYYIGYVYIIEYRVYIEGFLAVKAFTERTTLPP